MAASPASRPTTTPAISTARPVPWVTGRATNSGMITAAATTGRSSRSGPILRAGPRSVASTVASTTPLTIIASVSVETMMCSRVSCSFRLMNPPSRPSPFCESEHRLALGMRKHARPSTRWYQTGFAGFGPGLGTLGRRPVARSSLASVSPALGQGRLGRSKGHQAGVRASGPEGAAMPGPEIRSRVLAPGDHGGCGRPRLALPGDTGDMPRTVNWLARVLGFAWLGLLAFLLAPVQGPFAVPVQAAGYCLLGLGLVAWAVIDVHPAAARDHTWVVSVLRGVIAVGAGVACAVGGGGTAMVAFGFVAAMAAGGNSGLAPALAVTGAGILAIEISGLAFGGGYGTLLGLPVLVASGLLIGRNWGAYRVQAEQATQLLAQSDQLRAEQRRADLLDERARIAREIHDVLAHSLGALGIQIQAARAVLTDHGDVDRAGEILAAAQRMAAEGLVETRRAVHALRTDTLPLHEELARVSGTHAQRYHVPATFDVGGSPGPLPPDATVALLRVAQESLVNAAKHAAGEGVTVRLDYSDVDVRLTVRNDLPPGFGSDGEASVSTVNGGYGLTGMRERLRLLNGTLQAGRQDSQWIVTAELPRSQPEIVMP